MPREVKAAIVVMMLQMIVGVPEFWIGFMFLALAIGDTPGLDLPGWPFWLAFALMVLPGPLALAFSLRRRWVRVATLGTEWVLALAHACFLLLGFIMNFCAAINLVLAVLVAVKLSDTEVTRWFEREKRPADSSLLKRQKGGFSSVLYAECRIKVISISYLDPLRPCVRL
ncbi:hypothetical protein ACQPYK_32425 [Streptosporangium sp. CA-135522]|uniref:hypothetical protein n=1 Tax=Streptosporangium sp. CA-135522 TaxID=3240072 RepID=UPI003D8CE289